MKIVNNMILLKAMAKRGLIKFHADTGKKGINAMGKPFTFYYVDGRGNLPTTFKYGRPEKTYQLQYIEGCFCPFVVEIS